MILPGVGWVQMAETLMPETGGGGQGQGGGARRGMGPGAKLCGRLKGEKAWCIRGDGEGTFSLNESLAGSPTCPPSSSRGRPMSATWTPPSAASPSGVWLPPLPMPWPARRELPPNGVTPLATAWGPDSAKPWQ